MDYPHRISPFPAEALLNVAVSDLGADSVLCVLIGEVDLVTGPLLREKLAGAITSGPRHMVIDLSDVQFLGSLGLKILVELRAAQRAAGHQLALVVDNNRMVTRILRVTGLDQVFDLHTELGAAVAACRVAAGVKEH